MILNVWYSEQVKKWLGTRAKMCRGWKEETHTKEMPNAQRNGDFVYDSAETFGFLALPSAWSYNTAYTLRAKALVLWDIAPYGRNVVYAGNVNYLLCCLFLSRYPAGFAS